MSMTTSIQIQTGTYCFYGSIVPIFTTIWETEIKELTALGMTRSEAIDYLIQ